LIITAFKLNLLQNFNSVLFSKDSYTHIRPGILHGVGHASFKKLDLAMARGPRQIGAEPTCVHKRRGKTMEMTKQFREGCEESQLSSQDCLADAKYCFLGDNDQLL